MSTMDIAAALVIRPETVKTHIFGDRGFSVLCGCHLAVAGSVTRPGIFVVFEDDSALPVWECPAG